MATSLFAVDICTGAECGNCAVGYCGGNLAHLLFAAVSCCEDTLGFGGTGFVRVDIAVFVKAHKGFKSLVVGGKTDSNKYSVNGKLREASVLGLEYNSLKVAVSLKAVHNRGIDYLYVIPVKKCFGYLLFSCKVREILNDCYLLTGFSKE